MKLLFYTVNKITKQINLLTKKNIEYSYYFLKHSSNTKNINVQYLQLIFMFNILIINYI